MLLIVTQRSALLHRPVALRVDRAPAPSRVPSRLTAAMTDWPQHLRRRRLRPAPVSALGRPYASQRHALG
jgi:hypothetical protein